MVCLYCGKKLTMVKKLTAEDFCSVAHRQAYNGEQEKLAVARLVDQQMRMGTGRKPAAQVRPISKPLPPQPGEYISQQIAPSDSRSALWLSGQQLTIALVPMGPESSATIAPPHSFADPISFVNTSTVEDAMRAIGEAQAVEPTIATPHLLFRSYRADLEALPSAFQPVEIVPQAFSSPALPQAKSELELPEHPPVEPDFDSASLSLIDLAANLRPQSPAAIASIDSYGAKRFAFSQLPQANTQRKFSPTPPLPSPLEDTELAPGELSTGARQSPLARFQISDPAQLHPAAQTLADLDLAQRGGVVAFELAASPKASGAATPPAARPDYFSPPAPSIAVIESALRPLRLVIAGPIQRLLARPKLYPPRSPRLVAFPRIAGALPAVVGISASGGFQSILFRQFSGCQRSEAALLHPATFVRAISPANPTQRVVPIPQKARVAGVRRSSLEIRSPGFRPSQMVPVPYTAVVAEAAPRLREAVAVERLGIFRPQLRLAIIAARDVSSPFSALSQLSGGKFTLSWTALRRRWEEAPNDLRWIALAVPLVISLIWFANSPGLKDNAKQSVTGRFSSIAPNVTGILNTGDTFAGLREGIQRRAAVELSDDFRQGLGEWSGAGDWARGWNYDPAGFIRPRQLALYTPTIALENYRFEFLGAIEKRALSWVFRAADLKNYYVSRLEITKGGPIPTVELVRFAVVNGRAGPRKSTPLPFQGRLDTIYRVAVEARGTDFVTTVQGQVVDVFTDDRLARGGVGFYTEAGEDARLRWVEVSHQYDFLGRLCAFLVPYNVSNPNVRSEQ